MSGLRRLVVVVTFILTGSMLLACSGGSDEPRAGTSPTASTPPEPPRVPARGDCHQLTWAQALAPSASTAEQPCRGTTAITFHVGRLGRTSRGETRQPDSRPVQRRMAEVCPRRLAEFLGGDEESRRLSVLRTVWFTPTPDEVVAGADWFRCDIVAPAAGEKLLQLRRPVGGILADSERRERYALCATGRPGNDSFTRVPCARDHAWRAMATVDLQGDAYPGADTLDSQLRQPCTDVAVDAADDPADLTWHQEVPTPSQWRDGQRYGVCWLPTSG